MILLQIHSIGITIFKLECNAPWPVDMHRITGGIKTIQSMEIKARQVHIFRFPCNIQPIKPHQYSLYEPLVEFGRLSALKQLCKRLAFGWMLFDLPHDINTQLQEDFLVVLKE